ncbi:MAG: hypothetical protein IT216_11855 [Saprospiraceae bacterium]|nr:hypothetical protein [Saprospiraceae bacterium]WKZ62329.1 MAG: hypothetical protein QY315_11225 [Saprospiraceae bacterium]
MNYQAVARDSKGQIIANKDLDLKISLSSFQAEKEYIYYSEQHRLTTNSLGLFSLIIGEGSVLSGSYEKIPWATEDIYINVSIKDISSDTYESISNSKLQAVPYAYHAITASQLTGDDGLSLRAEEPFWSTFGNYLVEFRKAQLGSRDCADVIIVSNNIERMRVLCDGNITMENDLTVKHDVTVQNNFSVWGDVVLNSNYKDHFTSTLINGPLTVANRQPTYLTGTLTVDKDTWLKSRLRVDGITDLNDALNVNNGAPTYLSGTLTVDQATWLKNTLVVDGITNLNAALYVNNMAPTYLSGTLNVDKDTWLKSRLRVDGITDLNDALNVNNMAPTHLSGTLTVDKRTDLNDSLNVNNNKPTLLTGTLQVNQKGTFKDQVILDNAGFQSTSTTTGALVVSGGIGIGKNLWLGGEFHSLGPMKLESSLDVQGPTNFYGTITAHKFADFLAGVKISGKTTLDSSLIVNGVADFNNNVNINGTTTTKAINANGQVTIKAALGKSEGDYSKYPLRVEGSGQGIAIKVTDGTVNNTNNFITFFDGGGNAVGAIEGETFDEKKNTPEYIFEQTMLVAEEAKAIANQVLALIPIVVAGFGASAGPCGPCIAMAAADLVLATANLIAFNVFAGQDIGVTYSSGSADYAEWLERIQPGERLLAGDIVGVYNGKITKYTKDAQQLFVISTKPAVLGNTPESGKEVYYDKVAFMGQIPVKVRGLVMPGDYILPSGSNDGCGIAVSPDRLTPSQYKDIVGIAWSSASASNGISMVNMAIGLNSNDMARLGEQQERRISELESKFSALEARMAVLEGKSQNGSNTAVAVAEQMRLTPQPVSNQTKEQLALANMPPELSDEVMAEAIEFLRNQFNQTGVDYNKHPGLTKLFTDLAFQREVIRRSQENYKIGYQKIMSGK